MNVQKPTEEELRTRILAHLQARPGKPMVAAVWQGYIAGLLEWGVIDVGVHDRLLAFLPKVGSDEVVEIMLGTDYVDAHPELLQKRFVPAGL